MNGLRKQRVLMVQTRVSMGLVIIYTSVNGLRKQRVLMVQTPVRLSKLHKMITAHTNLQKNVL